MTSTLTDEIRLMKSAHTGRNYRVTVSLPLAYRQPQIKRWPFDEVPAKWPVIYVLDANWYFGLVTDMVRAMAAGGTTTDAIIVGLGYPEEPDPLDAWRDTFVRRNLDFTPSRDEDHEKYWDEIVGHPCPTGDAGNFLQFIKNEVMPMVEQEYQIDPTQRVLIGHSSGGLFTAFALLEQPDLFSHYIIGSLYFPYGRHFIFKREEQFAERHQRLPANVYLSVGSLEESVDNTSITDMLRFAAVLENRKYAGLSVRKQIFADLSHCEVIAPCFQAGLKLALMK
jgi:predicted alpha/beta superfamily hydrolase